jgi:hypothetical protein
MSALPILADFTVRLAFGLIMALLLTSWRAVPLRFFRIQALVILGVLVLAVLAQARAVGPGPSGWLVVVGALLAYTATVCWGLGLPQAGRAAGILVALATAAWLIEASRAPHASLWALNASSRAASGFLMGATLTAMLLGHSYLIAPSMTIEPLGRAVTLIAVGLVARGLLAGTGVAVLEAERFASDIGRHPSDAPLLAVRWGVGFAAAAISVYLTRRTVQIRSTQSATGILYITTIFVLLGELTSMINAGSGVIV